MDGTFVEIEEVVNEFFNAADELINKYKQKEKGE